MEIKERCKAIYTNFRDRLPDLLSTLCGTSEADTETFKKLENELQFILLSVARRDIWETWSKEDCVRILRPGCEVLSLHFPSETTAYYSCLQDFLEYLMLHHQIQDERICFGVWYGGMVSDLFYASRVGGEDKYGNYFEMCVASLSSSCLRDWKTYLKMLDTTQAFRLNELIGEVLKLSKSKGWSIGSYTEEYLRNLSTGCVSKLIRKGNMKTKQKSSKYLEMVNLLSDAITDKYLNREQHTRLSELFRLICATSLPHRWSKEKRETVVQLVTRNVELGFFGETDKAIVETLRALKKLLPHSEIKKKTYGAGVGAGICDAAVAIDTLEKVAKESGHTDVAKDIRECKDLVQSNYEKVKWVYPNQESQSEQPVEEFGNKITKFLPYLYCLMVKLNRSILPAIEQIDQAFDEVRGFDFKKLTPHDTNKLELNLYRLIKDCKDKFPSRVFGDRVAAVLETYRSLADQIKHNVSKKEYDPQMKVRERTVDYWLEELFDKLDDDSEYEPEDNRGYIKMNTTQSNRPTVYTCVVNVRDVIKSYQKFLEKNFTEEAMKVCPNKRKVGGLLKEKLECIEVYASVIPGRILKECNIFTHTQCPVETDGWSYTHQDEWLEKEVFGAIEKCEKLLLNHQSQEKDADSSLQRKLVLEKLKSASTVALDYLTWLGQGLQEVALRLIPTGNNCIP